MSRATSHGLVLGAAVFVASWAAILVRSCDAPSLGIAFYRMAIASLFLVPWSSALRRESRGTAIAPAILAGLFLAAHFGAWIASLSYTSVASSVLLVSTTPVFTAVLGPFVLGERPGRRTWAAVGLCLGGTAILTGGDLAVDPRALLGDGLALAGALCASVYLMIGRRVRARIDLGPYLLLVYSCAAVGLAAVALLTGTTLGGYGRATWLWLFVLALGPSLAGHGLINWCVRRMRAITVSVAMLGEPVLATVYAAVLFGEIPPPTFYPGALLVLAGIGLALGDEAASGGGPDR
jgi:drug/metabolite transporter (DMT)-like permease